MKEKIIKQMEAVVADVMTDYQSDFFNYDKPRIESPESLEELFIDMAMTKTNLAVAVYLTILLWQEFGDDKLQTELEDNYVSYEAANTQIAWYEPI